MQNSKKDIAEILLLKALDYDEKGDVYNAVKLYKRVIRMSPDWSPPFSFLSLIYKKRCEWRPSLHYSQKAIEHNPFDEKAWYNLAISATALKKWETAREAWRQLGFKLKKSKNAPDLEMGLIPIRINTKTKPEIIWATKIDPARAVIQSIPQPSSHHNYQDLILFDNEPNGHHFINGKSIPVYDELEILKRSSYRIFITFLATDSKDDVQILDKLCLESNIGFDNWSNAYRVSNLGNSTKHLPEYFPPEILEEKQERNNFMVALAAKNTKLVHEVLENWKVISLKGFGKVYRI